LLSNRATVRPERAGCGWNVREVSRRREEENAVPTYTCTAAAGLLDAGQKGTIARVVTLAHAEITGAPTHFAQVIFADVPEGDHFMGGVPLEHESVFIYGSIRDGRSAVDRKALIQRLTADIAQAARVAPFSVWVYLLELPAAAMVEFGHILPEAGDEPAWTAALPADDHAAMESIQARLAR
jgi:phenylpyruvate tautomerase PptA (4-oxalocrotonate tautomerase family)